MLVQYWSAQQAVEVGAVQVHSRMQILELMALVGVGAVPHL
jgi:hypothetical protein